MRPIIILILTLITAWPAQARAQCSVDIPVDTVTIFWGYEPLSCATVSAIGAGIDPIAFQWSNGPTTATSTFCDTVPAWHHVILTDGDACTASDSIYVLVMDVRCGTNLQKVSVCHVPPGDPANEHTICIGATAVDAHLSHGCRLGHCSVTVPGGLQMEVSPNPVVDEATITITSSTTIPVTLTAMDASGKTSMTLFEGVVYEGTPLLLPFHALTWDGRGRMVWFKLAGGGTIITRKVMVLG